MEATCSSEMSVDCQRTTRRYIPEDKTLHSHRRKDLKPVWSDSGPKKLFRHGVLCTPRLTVLWIKTRNIASCSRTVLLSCMKFRSHSQYRIRAIKSVRCSSCMTRRRYVRSLCFFLFLFYEQTSNICLVTAEDYTGHFVRALSQNCDSTSMMGD
jgi:hypothetical protein